MRVSACVITKNESDHIEKCIESCKRIAQEMIVVDTGSADDTAAKAKALGAEVYNFQWIDDFAAAKNFALSKACGDWVFFPDADEYIEEDTARLLLACMKQCLNDQNVDVIGARLYNIDQKTGGVQKGLPVTRLFKNNGQIHYKGSIHEKLFRKGGGRLNRMMIEQAVIYHTGYSADAMPQKYERNLRMLFEAEKRGEADASNLCHIASSLFFLGRYEEAMAYADKLERHSGYEALLHDFSLMPHFFIIKALSMQKCPKYYTYDQIIAVLEEGERRYPDCGEITEQKIKWMVQWERYEEVLGIYERKIKSLSCANESEAIIKRDKARVFVGMGSVYVARGDREAAFDCYLKAVVADFTFDRAALGLLNIVRRQPTGEVVALLNQIYDPTMPEQAGFLAFVSSRAMVPEVFLHYFNLLCAEETDRYRQYQMYKNFFLGHYDQAAQMADAFLMAEKKPEKRKEWQTIYLASKVLRQFKQDGELSPFTGEGNFADVLGILLKIDEIPAAEKWMDLIPQDDAGIMQEVADVMRDVGFYDAAAELLADMEKKLTS